MEWRRRGGWSSSSSLSLASGPARASTATSCQSFQPFPTALCLGVDRWRWCPPPHLNIRSTHSRNHPFAITIDFAVVAIIDSTMALALWLPWRVSSQMTLHLVRAKCGSWPLQGSLAGLSCASAATTVQQMHKRRQFAPRIHDCSTREYLPPVLPLQALWAFRRRCPNPPPCPCARKSAMRPLLRVA